MMHEAAAELLEQIAEGQLAVGIADRLEVFQAGRLEVLQVAVVRKDPVLPPQFALEGMAVLQRDLPLVALRMWAITCLERIGYCRTSSAIGDSMVALASRNSRQPAPSKKAMPQPSR